MCECFGNRKYVVSVCHLLKRAEQTWKEQGCLYETTITWLCYYLLQQWQTIRQNQMWGFIYSFEFDHQPRALVDSLILIRIFPLTLFLKASGIVTTCSSLACHVLFSEQVLQLRGGIIWHVSGAKHVLWSVLDCNTLLCILLRSNTIMWLLF